MDSIISELIDMCNIFTEQTEMIENSLNASNLVLGLFEESDESELKDFLESSKKEANGSLKSKISKIFENIQETFSKFVSALKEKAPKIKQKPKSFMDKLEDGSEKVVNKSIKIVHYDELLDFYKQSMEELRILTVGKNGKEKAQDFFAKFIPMVRKKRDEEVKHRRKCTAIVVSFTAFGLVANKMLESIEKTADEMEYKCSAIKKDIDKTVSTSVVHEDGESDENIITEEDIARVSMAILQEAAYYSRQFAIAANQQLVELQGAKVVEAK